VLTDIGAQILLEGGTQSVALRCAHAQHLPTARHQRAQPARGCIR
jgi:hypothetical protein